MTYEATGGKSDRWANAFLIRQGDRFFLPNEKGDLIIARLDREGYHELSRAHLIEPTGSAQQRKVVWSHPRSRIAPSTCETMKRSSARASRSERSVAVVGQDSGRFIGIEPLGLLQLQGLISDLQNRILADVLRRTEKQEGPCGVNQDFAEICGSVAPVCMRDELVATGPPADRFARPPSSGSSRAEVQRAQRCDVSG